MVMDSRTNLEVACFFIGRGPISDDSRRGIWVKGLDLVVFLILRITYTNNIYIYIYIYR